MAKTYVPCQTQAECEAACAAGLLYWWYEAGEAGRGWLRYSSAYKYPFDEYHRKYFRTSILVDTDEE